MLSSYGFFPYYILKLTGFFRGREGYSLTRVAGEAILRPMARESV
jgi:hypothetical protein